jgi:Fe-S-cluster-containing hydrogenase component 2
MIAFFVESTGSFAVGLVLLGLLVAIVVNLVHDRRRTACSGCSGCAAQCPVGGDTVLSNGKKHQISAPDRRFADLADSCVRRGETT